MKTRIHPTLHIRCMLALAVPQFFAMQSAEVPADAEEPMYIYLLMKLSGSVLPFAAKAAGS